MGIDQKRNPFYYAISGLIVAFRKELHIRIHFFAMLLVVIAAWWFSVSAWEWVALIFCCAFVIILEMLNTALEVLCDVVSPGYSSQIKFIKDLLAGTVLVAVVFAVVVGLIVFSPYLA